MRKFVCFLSTFLFIITLTISTFATGSENILINEEITTNESHIEERKFATPDSEEVRPNDYYGERHVYRETIRTEKVVYCTPTGQPALGYEGGSDALVFFFETGGSSTTYTLTIEGQIVKLSVESGAQTGYGSGYGDYVPDASGRYKFQFIKRYVILTKVYDIYQGIDYKYTILVHENQGYSLSHRWLKIAD